MAEWVTRSSWKSPCPSATLRVIVSKASTAFDIIQGAGITGNETISRKIEKKIK